MWTFSIYDTVRVTDMKTKNNNLSICARYARWSLRTGGIHGRNTYSAWKFLIIPTLIVSALNFTIWSLDKGVLYLILAMTWLAISFVCFMRAGFMELLEKEYTKKELEPVN
jgi:hypothetical protein